MNFKNKNTSTLTQMRAKSAMLFVGAFLLLIFSFQTLVRSQSHIEKAHSLYRKGNYNEVMIWCDKILKKDETNVEALMLRGNSLAWLGIYDEAIQSYEQALKWDDQNYKILNNLAVSLFHKGEQIEATRIFKASIDQAKSLGVNYHVASSNLANTAILIIGDVKFATKHYRRSLEAYPEYEVAQNNLNLVQQYQNNSQIRDKETDEQYHKQMEQIYMLGSLGACSPYEPNNTCNQIRAAMRQAEEQNSITNLPLIFGIDN